MRLCLLLLLYLQWCAAQEYGKPIKIVAKLESAYLGADEQSLRSLISSLISEANSTYGGRLHLQYQNAIAEVPPGATAIISAASCGKIHMLDKKLIKTGTVHFGVTGLGCPRSRAATSLLSPRIDKSSTLDQLLIDLRTTDSLTWKSFVFLYDSSISAEAQKRIMAEIEQDEMSTFSFHNLGNTDQVDRARLNMLFGKIPFRDIGGKFLFAVSKNIVSTILEEARFSGLMSTNTQFLFMIPDTSDVDSKILSDLEKSMDGENVAFLYNSSAPSSEGQFCTAEELIRGYLDIIGQIIQEDESMYSGVSMEKYNIMKPSKMKKSTSTIKRLRNYIRTNGSCGNCVFWKAEASEIQDDASAQRLEVATWSPVLGFAVKDDLFPHVSGGLRRRRVTITSNDYYPWTILKKDDAFPPNVVSSSGIVFEMLDDIAESLNFTYTVIAPTDNAFGVREKGEYTGMMGQLIKQEAFLAAAPFIVNHDKQMYVNFSTEFDMQPYSFMYRRRGTVPKFLIFVYPFTPLVWLCLGIAAALFGPFLWMVQRLSYYYKVSENGYGALGDLGNSVWYAVGTCFCQEGNATSAEAISARIILAFWWLFIVIVVTLYSGSLVAFLTFPIMEKPVENIDELIAMDNAASSVTWGLFNGSEIEGQLRNAMGTKFEKLYKMSAYHANPGNPWDNYNESPVTQDVLNAVREDDHILIDWRPTLDLLMKNEYGKTMTCDYTLGIGHFYTERVAMAFPMGNPWMEKINERIKSMVEGGLIDKWKYQYWPRDDECSWKGDGSSDDQTLYVADFVGYFLLLVVGIAVAVPVLMFELGGMKRKKSAEMSKVKPFTP